MTAHIIIHVIIVTCVGLRKKRARGRNAPHSDAASGSMGAMCHLAPQDDTSLILTLVAPIILSLSHLPLPLLLPLPPPPPLPLLKKQHHQQLCWLRRSACAHGERRAVATSPWSAEWRAALTASACTPRHAAAASGRVSERRRPRQGGKRGQACIRENPASGTEKTDR